jgi:hypothetical protein
MNKGGKVWFVFELRASNFVIDWSFAVAWLFWRNTKADGSF